MAINAVVKDGVCSIKLTGKIDASYLLDVQDELFDKALVSTKIILDMSQVEYISSAGLRMLLSTHKTMAKKDGLVILNPSEGVMQILNITGFNKVLTIE